MFLHWVLIYSFSFCIVFHVWIKHNMIVHCITNGPCGGVTHSAARNILILLFWWTFICLSVGFIPRGRTAGAEEILSRFCQNCLHSSCPIYTPTSRCVRIPVAQQPLNLILFVFLFQPFWWAGGVIDCGFNLHCPDDWWR